MKKWGFFALACVYTLSGLAITKFLQKAKFYRKKERKLPKGEVYHFRINTGEICQLRLYSKSGNQILLVMPGVSGSISQEYFFALQKLPTTLAIINYEKVKTVTGGFAEREILTNAYKLIKLYFPESEIILYGISMGGLASLLFASEQPEIKALILDSTFCDLEAVLLKNILQLPILKIFRPIYRMYYWLKWHSISLKSVLQKARKVKVPTLVIHSLKDEIISYQQSLLIVKALPKGFWLVLNTGHAQSWQSELYLKTIREFLSQKGQG